MIYFIFFVLSCTATISLLLRRTLVLIGMLLSLSKYQQ